MAPRIRPGPKGPPPRHVWRKGRHPISLRLEGLSINESLRVAPKDAREAHQVRGIASALGRRLGRRYTCRTLDGGQLGVWRTA